MYCAEMKFIAKYQKSKLPIVLLSDLWSSNSFIRDNSIEILLYLVSERKERDTIRSK